MAKTSNNGILAIVVVVIVVVAALVAAVVMTNSSKSDSNPNGIVGTYEMATIEECGRAGEQGTGVEWIEKADYSDLKFIIDSYDDGVIEGSLFLQGVDHPFVGYYSPDSGVIGYGCNFEKKYDDGTKVTLIDSASGVHVDKTIFLAGYTMQIGGTGYMYAFNYSFVKAGETPVKFNFDQVTMPEGNIYGYGTSIETSSGRPGPDAMIQTSLKFKEFNNGVYYLMMGDEDLLATTIYQDDNTTVLKGVSSNEGYTSYLMYFSGDKFYCVDNYIYGSEISRATYTKDMKPELSPYDLDKKEMEQYRSTYSSKFDKYSETANTSVFTKRLDNTLVTPMVSKGLWTLVAVFPEIDYVAYTDVFPMNESEYYSEMTGFVDGNGNIRFVGFAFGTNGDVIVAKCTMLDTEY